MPSTVRFSEHKAFSLHVCVSLCGFTSTLCGGRRQVTWSPLVCMHRSRLASCSRFLVSSFRFWCQAARHLICSGVLAGISSNGKQLERVGTA